MLYQIKKHVRKHKTAYTIAGTAVTVAGITYLIMRGRHANFVTSLGGLETADTSVTVRPLSFLSKQTNQIVTTVHTGTRGNPGFVVRNIENDMFFRTQKDAADYFNIDKMNLSRHLNGRYDHANGLHFERVGITS